MNLKKAAFIAATAGLLLQDTAFSQGAINYDYNSNNNTIVTAVPFLRIVPDARFGGMGDVGIAMSPDPNSIHFNLSNLAFVEDNIGVSATYTPWLKNLGLSDVYMAHLSEYTRIDELQTIGFGLRYFSLGQINFTDYNGESLGGDRPNEFEISAGYARKLGKNFSAGITMKFIYSKLAQGYYNGINIRPGTAVASDISFTWRKPMKFASKKTGLLTIAGAVTNLGTKISYVQNSDNKDFIPTNLGIGASFLYNLDDHNSLTFGLDINRLLVPTPIPRQVTDENGDVIDNPEFDTDGNDIPDYKEQSVIKAFFSSFGDAPGGVTEELREFMISAGIEYWYNKQFAARAGYFYEHPLKGARRYLSVGLGLRYSVFGINFSYLVPTSNNRNPLDNTLRFSLLFNINTEKNDDAVIEE